MDQLAASLVVVNEMPNRILDRGFLVKSRDSLYEFRSLLADDRPRLNEEVCVERLKLVAQTVLNLRRIFLKVDGEVVRR